MVYIDNKVALRQLQLANAELLRRQSARTPEDGKSIARDGKFHPRVLTLVRAPAFFVHFCEKFHNDWGLMQGGDHTITLPLLRGVHEIYGPVSVIHFDSHLGSSACSPAPTRLLTGMPPSDTWMPRNIVFHSPFPPRLFPTHLALQSGGPWLPDEVRPRL